MNNQNTEKAKATLKVTKKSLNPSICGKISVKQ